MSRLSGCLRQRVFERGQGSPRPGAPRSMFSLALPTGKITEDREKTLKRDHQSALVPERESHSQCICAAVLPIRTVGILDNLGNRAWQFTTCNSLRLQSCNSPFQQPERVPGFFNTCRDGKRVICRTLTEIADDFHHWVIHRAERWRAPIVEAPHPERRDDSVLPYLQKTEAVILKAREPARILVAIGGKQNQCPHLELKQRWVNQYNFYLNDQHWGPMFVRMCPYFPFSARVCLNQHHGLALQINRKASPFGNARTPFCNAPTS